MESDSETDSETDSKPNGYIVLRRTFPIPQTQTWIPTAYFWIRQESESESSNVFEPLEYVHINRFYHWYQHRCPNELFDRCIKAMFARKKHREPKLQSNRFVSQRFGPALHCKNKCRNLTSLAANSSSVPIHGSHFAGLIKLLDFSSIFFIN